MSEVTESVWGRIFLDYHNYHYKFRIISVQWRFLSIINFRIKSVQWRFLSIINFGIISILNFRINYICFFRINFRSY
jgi:hypothetical protein